MIQHRQEHPAPQSGTHSLYQGADANASGTEVSKNVSSQDNRHVCSCVNIIMQGESPLGGLPVHRGQQGTLPLEILFL